MKVDSNSMNAWELKRIVLLWAYPALRQLPPAEWGEALKRAREMSFDMIEWVGLMVGIAFVTYLLRFDADQAVALSLPVRYLVQFLVAVPLLFLVVGPLYLRRIRRGLEQEIESRFGAGRSNQLG